ncbi:MAG: GNAT family N-acetyltransferase [Bacteroidia bacterium]|nr:GNAT family N-acetyltransferase [Bacteroidia bacterium]
MKLVKYGVTLRRLCADDLELLRTWRNSDYVRQFMEYREYISPEMQQKWFETVNNPDNFFYIIEHNNEKIGMINEKNLDRNGKGTTESGILIAYEKYSNTFIPVCASLIMIEISLYLLNGKESYIRILKDNLRSISYNKKLGYQLCPGQEGIENQQYVLTRKSFEESTRKLRKAASKLSGGDNNLYIIFYREDFESGLAQAAGKLLETLPIVIQKKTGENGSTVYFYDMDFHSSGNKGLYDPDLKISPFSY